MGKLPVVSGLLGFAMLLLAAGCTGDSGSRAAPTSAPGSEQVIRLGTLVQATGPNAAEGAVDRKSFEMAVHDLNARGGVLGRRVVLEVVDSGCDLEQAVVAARELVRRDVHLSVGAACSTSLVQIIPILRAAGIAHIESSANSPDLLKNRYEGLFLLTGTAADEAATAVAWLPRLGAHRTAIVYDGTNYPLAFAQSLQRTLTSAKRPSSAFLEIVQGAARYPSAVRTILASDADSVFYTGYSAEAGVLVKDLRAAGFTGPVILGDSGTSLGMIGISGARALRNVYFVTPPMPGTTPSGKAWLNRFRTFARSEPGAFSMQTYMSVMIAAAAIERAGNTDRDPVRAAITGTVVDGPYGRVAFDARGVDTGTGFQLLVIKDNAFRPVCPPSCR